MSTVELYNPDIWPLSSGEEVSSEHFEQIRKNIWLIEHPCAGNIDTTIKYGKWVGNSSTFQYVEYTYQNWDDWNVGADYHYGSPIVKFRWGPGADEVDIFIWNSEGTGEKINQNPPVMGGQLNRNFWLLGVDPNKYSHWNKNAGRPDIGAEHRYIFRDQGDHFYIEEPDGPGWCYGYWEAWRELPVHTNPFEQIPHIKQGGVDEARHYPAEQEKDWITKQIRPVMERKYKDGFVGDPPTFWVHNEDRETVSEYVYTKGDPVGSMQIGPDRIDPKYNQALQDRVIHCIERNYQYLKAVDDEWKQSFNFSSTYGQNIDPDYDNGCCCVENYRETYRGTWTYSPSGWYYKGEIVYHNFYWYRCIQDQYADGADDAPDTAGGEDYWAKPRHQPDYIDSDPIYIQFASYLFNCNCSAFEKVLKCIGNYDWYWAEEKEYQFDERYEERPAMPWWLYQKYYYLMTLHRADPDAGWGKKAEERWPLPVGCWRKVWRYTMCWDHDREVGQKGRLGKVIDIDGEKVSMMWPGDLGPPPGYDSIEVFTGELNGYHYNTRQLALIISQDKYDKMERPAGDETAYTKYYLTKGNVDGEGNSIEDLFKAQYRLRKNSIESRLKARHDPLATEWHQNEITGELKEYPIFEIRPELVNDIKDALEQLKLLAQENDVASQAYNSQAADAQYDTALEAYDAGKAECEAETNTTASSGIFGDVGFVGLVRYNAGVPTHYSPSGTVTHDYQCEKAWVEVTVTKGAGICFPATSVGTLIFDVLAKGYLADETCSIGIPGVFSFKPPDVDNKWYRAYVGQIPMSCEWEHDGDGDLSTDWNLKCKFRIVPAEDWPDEIYFNFDGPSDYPLGGGRDKYVQTHVNITTGSDVSMVWQINFDGFDASVFEEDLTNYIEV